MTLLAFLAPLAVAFAMARYALRPDPYTARRPRHADRRRGGTR